MIKYELEYFSKLVQNIHVYFHILGIFLKHLKYFVENIQIRMKSYNSVIDNRNGSLINIELICINEQDNVYAGRNVDNKIG